MTSIGAEVPDIMVDVAMLVGVLLLIMGRDGAMLGIPDAAACETGMERLWIIPWPGMDVPVDEISVLDGAVRTKYVVKG